jgi:hypothetical protein
MNTERKCAHCSASAFMTADLAQLAAKARRTGRYDRDLIETLRDAGGDDLVNLFMDSRSLADLYADAIAMAKARIARGHNRQTVINETAVYWANGNAALAKKIGAQIRKPRGDTYRAKENFAEFRETQLSERDEDV